MRYVYPWMRSSISTHVRIWVMYSLFMSTGHAEWVAPHDTHDYGTALQLREPHDYPDEPWVMCLLTEGPHLVYRAHLYTVQPRYKTWTVDWRRYRPRGYRHDEEVGLVTTDHLQRALSDLMRVARQGALKPVVVHTAPPCTTEEVEERERHLDAPQGPLITTWLWVLAPTDQPHKRPRSSEHRRGQSTPPQMKANIEQPVSYRWYRWRFEDPHLDVQSAPRELIETVKRLVHTSAPPQEEIDLLLKPAERGSLILKVSQPARVWIDGVYQGDWPSLRMIYLPNGHYSIHVVPLDAHYEPISYEGVEILAGRQTTFKIQVE